MRVAVIGGGYAGLAAAVELARRDVAVELFEASPMAGGRARRTNLNGVKVDNGQHLLLGAYHETLRLIEFVAPGSTRTNLQREPLCLESVEGFRLAAPRLPAPWHLAAALLRARGLSWLDRLQALAFARKLVRHDDSCNAGTTVAELVAPAPPEVTRRLWTPLCLAALNTPPESASAQVFLNVLKAAFARAREDSDTLLARVDLTALFPEPAIAFLRARACKVHLATRVREIARDGALIRVASSSADASFDAVVCAVAPQQLRHIEGDAADFAQLAQTVNTQGFQPIITAYLQFDASLRLSRPMLALEHGPAQWIIDRGQLGGPPGLLAAVISAEGVHTDLMRQELAQAIAAQLAGVNPRWGEPQSLRIIHEKHATFACTPARHIPPIEINERVFLAGDYCDPEFPGTIEAAVRSGVRAATAVLVRYSGS